MTTPYQYAITQSRQSAAAAAAGAMDRPLLRREARIGQSDETLCAMHIPISRIGCEAPFGVGRKVMPRSAIVEQLLGLELQFSWLAGDGLIDIPRERGPISAAVADHSRARNIANVLDGIV